MCVFAINTSHISPLSMLVAGLHKQKITKYVYGSSLMLDMQVCFAFVGFGPLNEQKVSECVTLKLDVNQRC
ncbi:hypothetical protein PSCICF_03830 [Pseudomonas cichorii]|nr:hypothetical protein PSCICF_03830 [Pseudomonas cichorii]